MLAAVVVRSRSDISMVVAPKAPFMGISSLEDGEDEEALRECSAATVWRWYFVSGKPKTSYTYVSMRVSEE